MWNNAFNEDDPLNPKLADEYGIVMGTSHIEPMMRADKEWNRHGHRPRNGITRRTRTCCEQFWDEGIERNKTYESIITIGMRGDGDMPMAPMAGPRPISRCWKKSSPTSARSSRKRINPDVTKVPQLWALYKEVQDYYEEGMRVPDDVTLLWCDDNWGNIRRLPTRRRAESQRRRGHLLSFRLRRRPAQLQMDQHQSDRQDLGADEPGLQLRRRPDLDRERGRSEAHGVSD